MMARPPEVLPSGAFVVCRDIASQFADVRNRRLSTGSIEQTISCIYTDLAGLRFVISEKRQRADRSRALLAGQLKHFFERGGSRLEVHAAWISRYPWGVSY